MSGGRVAIPHRDEQHRQGAQHRYLGPPEHVGQHAPSEEGYLWLSRHSASCLTLRTLSSRFGLSRLYLIFSGCIICYTVDLARQCIIHSFRQMPAPAWVALSRDWTRSVRESRGRLRCHMNVTWSVPPNLGFSSSHHHDGLLQLGHEPCEYTQRL